MRSLRHRGAWAYKIPDAPITRELLKITRFTAPKPCDIVVNKGGSFYAIECKQIKKFRAFGGKDIRPAQVEHLTHIVQTGGVAYIFLNVRITNPRVNRLYVFDWKEWGDVLSTGTIKKKELEQMLFVEPELDSRKKIFFDLWEYV